MRLHTPLSVVESIQPTTIDAHSFTREEQKALYNSFAPETNEDTGEFVEFYHSAFEKNHRDGGLFEKIVPQIRDLFRESVLAYSEPEQLSGTTRRDGTTHKKHRSIIGYGNYLNKVSIDSKEYYVRFTIQRKKVESGLHSSFVSNVELYNNPVIVAYDPSSNGGGRLDYDRITDAKLRQYFDSAKENAEKLPGEGAARLIAYLYDKYGADGILNGNFTGNEKIAKLAASIQKYFKNGETNNNQFGRGSEGNGARTLSVGRSDLEHQREGRSREVERGADRGISSPTQGRRSGVESATDEGTLSQRGEESVVPEATSEGYEPVARTTETGAEQESVDGRRSLARGACG